MYLDQAVFSPAAVAFFFGSMSVLEGKGLGGAAERIGHVRLAALFFWPPSLTVPSLEQAYVPTLLRNWCVAAGNSNAFHTPRSF